MTASISESDRLLLDMFLRRTAYKTGRFILASGKESDEFLDVKNAVLRPDGFELLGELLHEVAGNMPPFNAIAGVVVGGIPLADALSQARWRRGWTSPTLIVRKEAKGHGTNQLVDGKDNLPPINPHFDDKDEVLIIEDVMTSGDSTVKTISTLKSDGLTPVGVIVVVDREAGGIEKIETEHKIPVVALTTLSRVRATQLSESNGSRINACGLLCCDVIKNEDAVKAIERANLSECSLGFIASVSATRLLVSYGFSVNAMQAIRRVLLAYGLRLRGY